MQHLSLCAGQGGCFAQPFGSDSPPEQPLRAARAFLRCSRQEADLLPPVSSFCQARLAILEKKKQNFVTFPKNRSSSLQQLGCYGKLLACKCQGTDLKPTVHRCSPRFSSRSKSGCSVRCRSPLLTVNCWFRCQFCCHTLLTLNHAAFR